ncbi:MAG: hypothetical protein WB445_04850 [Acinetobacter sp.]
MRQLELELALIYPGTVRLNCLISSADFINAIYLLMPKQPESLDIHHGEQL